MFAESLQEWRSLRVVAARRVALQVSSTLYSITRIIVITRRRFCPPSRIYRSACVSRDYARNDSLDYRRSGSSRYVCTTSILTYEKKTYYIINEFFHLNLFSCTVLHPDQLLNIIWTFISIYSSF